MVHCYHDLSKRIAIALKHEEIRYSNWFTREVHLLAINSWLKQTLISSLPFGQAGLKFWANLSLLFLIKLADNLPGLLPRGQVSSGWKVTCPAGKSTCPRWPDGTFLSTVYFKWFFLHKSHNTAFNQLHSWSEVLLAFCQQIVFKCLYSIFPSPSLTQCWCWLVSCWPNIPIFQYWFRR